MNHCAAVHRRTVAVQEYYQGRLIWDGEVEVFDLYHHPKANVCYAWSHKQGTNDEDERFVTVLGLPPVDSPESAVKVAIASEVRSKKLDRKSGV